jgi:hypothetical protein
VNLRVQNHRSTILKGVLFISCAIPGLLLFLVFSFAIFGRFFDLAGNYPSVSVSLGIVAVSMVLMLIGVGKWGEWRYLFVFLSIPLSLFGYILLDGGGVGGKLMPGIIVGAFAFWVLHMVRNKPTDHSERDLHQKDRADQ